MTKLAVFIMGGERKEESEIMPSFLTWVLGQDTTENKNSSREKYKTAGVTSCMRVTSEDAGEAGLGCGGN